MAMRRREFFGITAFTALQFYVQGCGFGQQRLQDGADPRLRTKGGTADGPLGFGPLLERPGQLLDLPAGFEYVVIQKGGDPQ